MKRLFWLMLSALLLALPLQAQPRKQTFSGSPECMAHIPLYEEGRDFYLNPYAGGQSGSLIVLKTADGNHRIWDNVAKTWVTEPLKGLTTCFFLMPNYLFMGKENGNGRCRFYPTAMLDLLDPEELDDGNMFYSGWAFRSSRGLPEELGLSFGGKWGVMGTDGEFLVPPRYGSFEAAHAALKERARYVKPMGMSDMEFIVSEVKRLWKEYEFDFVDLDVEDLWYDALGQREFYALRELPWCGPYMNFGVERPEEPEVAEDAETGEEDEVVEGHRVLLDAWIGVDNGVLAFIPDLALHKGAMLPLTMEVSRCLSKEPLPCDNGDIFYGESDYPGEAYGLMIHPDGSFQLGNFIASSRPDGSFKVIKYVSASTYWRYEDFYTHYLLSEHNKGRIPPEEEILKAFQEQVSSFFYNADFYARYDAEDKCLVLSFYPSLEDGCTVRIPATKAQADIFVQDNRDYEWQDFVIFFDRIVRDDGSVYIDNLRITSPHGIHLEYKAK